MKHTIQITGITGSIAALLLLTAPPLRAAIDTWNGTTNALWDTNTNWSLAAKLAAADDALFPTPRPATGPAITLGAAETANSLTFLDNYTLTGGDLALTSGNVGVAPGYTATLASQLTGAASALNKIGGGTLVVSRNNSYGGGTTLFVGTLLAGCNTALGAGLVTINQNSTFGANATVTLANNVKVNGDFNLAVPNTNFQNTLTFNGTFDLAGGTRTIINSTSSGQWCSPGRS